MKGKKPRKLKRIPDFRSDAEAARFWETHDLADYIDDMKATEEVRFERPPKQVVTLRLDRPLIQRLRAIALEKGIPYSTLIRMWLIERCSQGASKRAGA